jgi:hypothetical protein
MVGGEIYTLWKAKWQKPPKTGEVSRPRLPVLTKTIEILMKRLPGCFGTSQGCHKTLDVINFYFQQTSETAQGSQAVGKGNQEFSPCSSPIIATS